MPNQNTRGNNDTPHDEDEPPARHDDVRATELTRFQLDQLAVIARLDSTNTQSYGLAVKEALAAYHGESIHHPRNYQNLDALAEQELVAKSDHDGRTNQYELTEHGRELLVERVQWLADHLGLHVLDADRSRDNGDDPDDGGAVVLSDGGWSCSEDPETLMQVRDDIVDRVLSRSRPNPSELLAIEGDRTLASGSETDGGRR